MSDQKNYSELSVDELKKEFEELLKERFAVRMQKVTGQAVKTHLLKALRRNIARVKMYLSAKGVKV
ncbi:MAG: rpmC [Gammaproteobacteria bacterium]|jgi:large subunit ribosomal protein L29|nr:rpmC [Gammaproteobacteria bacterium]